MAKIPVLAAVRIIPRDDDYLDRKVGSLGEIFYDRTDNSLRLYDGQIAGGSALARADLTNVTTAALRAKSVESRLATVIYTVTIAGPQAPDVGNKYVLNGVYRPIPNFVVGYTYVFNQNDATNVYFPNAAGTTVNRHPLNFSSDNISGERGGGTSYLTDVQYSLNGAAVTQAVYNSSAFDTATARQVQITITNATPAVLYYWCYNHVLMGNEIAVADPGSGGGVSVSVSDAVPLNPNQGNLWFDTISGILHVYYEDVDSSQWVQPSNVSFGSSAGDPSNSFDTISVQGQNTVLADSSNDTLTLIAGQGIVITTNSAADSITFTSVANTGNITIADTTIDTNNGNAVTITTNLQLGGTLRFADNTVQTTATVQGPAGPAGPTGSGAGDVSSVGDGYTDNAVVRYNGTSGTSIQTSLASINDAGTFTAVAFSGAGSNLTALNATNLASGIIPNARFPAILPAASGANLTALNAANLTAGTVPDARFPATLPTASGANLTALNATNLGSGTVPVARLGTAGVRDATTFLRGDNTFAVASGGGGAASDSFATIAVAGQSNVTADSATDTLTLAAGANVTITTDASTDTITIAAAAAAAQNTFSTIAVAGQSDVIADQATDTLTLIAGTNITIATNAGTDAITINSTAAGGATAFTGLSDRADLTVDRFYLPAITMLAVTNNSTVAYRFDQYGAADNPTVYAINGTTIAFNLNVSGHPFLIQTVGGSNYDTGLTHVTTGGVVTSGSAAQGKVSGTLYWKIPEAISGGYRYVCSIHNIAMVGSISIKNFASI